MSRKLVRVFCACAYLLLMFAVEAIAVANDGGGAVAVSVRKKPRRGRQLAVSKSDAIPIHSYGERLLNAHGGGHEFSLTITLADGQEFDLIMDTGSPVTYLPCLGCPVELCGYHEHPYYDWTASSDFRVLDATANAADAAFCDALPVEHNVSAVSGECVFRLGYLDGSGGLGYMVEDVVSVGDELSPAKIIFGCGGLVEAGGSFDRQDGMAGFSRGETAFHTQLAKAGVIDAHVFGFCSEGSGTDTAMLSLGRYDFGRHLAPLSYTKILGDNDLAVRTTSWQLGNAFIAGSANVYTVLDSGTTLVLLPPVMYTDFLTQLLTQLNDTVPEPILFEDGCFYASNATTPLKHLLQREWFPELTITYDAGVELKLSSENYLHSHPYLPHALCVGVEPSEDDTILLGQQTLRNTFVEYDIENSRVGMVATHCESLRETFAPDVPRRNSWKVVAILFIALFLLTLVVGVGRYSFLVCARSRSSVGFKWRVLDEEEADDDDLLDCKIEMSHVVTN